MAWVNKGSLKGPQGPKGADGANGSQGPKGDKGDAATITIGNVQTGAAGSSVSVTNSGTSSAAKLNFTIPRGDKGETGAQGPKGETGSQGPQGPKGADGETLQIAGMIFPYAGESAPAGYLMCDGSAVSRTQYPALFAAIGTKYGAGDGSTTFNLPDLIGRFVLGAGGSYELADEGGAATVALTENQMPAHTHAAGKREAPDGADMGFVTALNVTSDATGRLRIQAGSSGSLYTITSNRSADDSLGTSDIDNPMATASTGGGQAHENMPPYVSVNYIISTGTQATTTAIGDVTLPLPIAQGGTGASSRAAALQNLGITVGTDEAPATGTPGTLYVQVIS